MVFLVQKHPSIRRVLASRVAIREQEVRTFSLDIVRFVAMHSVVRPLLHKANKNAYVFRAAKHAKPKRVDPTLSKQNDW